MTGRGLSAQLQEEEPDVLDRLDRTERALQHLADVVAQHLPDTAREGIEDTRTILATGRLA